MVSFMAFCAMALTALVLPSLAQASTNDLSSRQDGVIPPSCERTCSPVNGVIFSPQDCDVIPEFCCPRTDMLQFVACFRCFDDDAFAKTGQHADNAQRQKVIDDLVSTCDARGFLIDVSKAQITLPGQDVNRSGIDIVPDNDPRSSTSASRAPTSRLSSSSSSPSSSLFTSTISVSGTSISPMLTPPTPSQSPSSSTPGPVNIGLPKNTGGALRINTVNFRSVLAVAALLPILSSFLLL